MRGRFLLLGTGSSTGTPLIGCHCPVCLSTAAFNKRLRPSALIEVAEKKFVIDVGPDFREQALKYGIDHLDGILITHSHYDHIAGIDELRALSFRDNKKIPCLLSEETFEEIKIRYHYMMQPMKDEREVVCSQLKFHLLRKTRGDVHFEGLPVGFFSYAQVGMKVTGYRFGNLAYVPDIHDYEETIFEAMAGVEILILDALKEDLSIAHFSLDEAMGFAKKTGVKQVIFTHIAHEMEHDRINQKLPSNMRLGYDGQEIFFEIPGP